MNVDINFERNDRSPSTAETLVISCGLTPREVQKLDVNRGEASIEDYITSALQLTGEGLVKVVEGISDNPEDESTDNMRIIITAADENAVALDEFRGGDTLSEYVLRTMNVERDPEYVEQMEQDQDRPFDAVTR